MIEFWCFSAFRKENPVNCKTGQEVYKLKEMEKNNISQWQPLKEEGSELLDLQTDRDRKWLCLGADCPSSCCGFVYPQANIFINEIIHLSHYFPINFHVVTQPDGKRVAALCIVLRLLSANAPCAYLREGEGCTLGEDRPLACKMFPFRVVKDETGEYRATRKLFCPGISEELGPNILMQDGSLNPLIEEACVKPAISGAENSEATRTFVETLEKHELIVPGCFSHRGEKMLLNFVDAMKLRALPKEILENFRENGYMDLIMAHMRSLDLIPKFIDEYLVWKERQKNT